MPASGPATDRGYRRAVNAWCLYDWANSAFITTIVTTVFSIYYIDVAGRDVGKEQAGYYWAYTTGITLLIVALLAPVLGAVADHSGKRKRFLGGFVVVGVIFTASLIVVGYGDLLLASILYMLARLGYAGANIFYDSLLPHVARPGDIDRVSARGYAMGYLGGGLLLLVNILMIKELGGFHGARWAFLSVAVWWAVFSVPIFRRVSEPPSAVTGGVNFRAGFRRLRRTFGAIRRYRQLLIFLIAFWLYNDGIGTIYSMAVTFGKQLELSGDSMIAAILAVQFIGMPCAIAFGRLARVLGTKGSIILGLGVYTAITVGTFLVSTFGVFTTTHFWIMAVAVALVQGGTQALSRSLFGAMAPTTKASEFFGFFNMSSKFATILGPFLYGAIGQLTGAPHWSILSVSIFFVVGAILLLRVDEKEGIRVAREADAVQEAGRTSAG